MELGQVTVAGKAQQCEILVPGHTEAFSFDKVVRTAMQEFAEANADYEVFEVGAYVKFRDDENEDWMIGKVTVAGPAGCCDVVERGYYAGRDVEPFIEVCAPVDGASVAAV